MSKCCKGKCWCRFLPHNWLCLRGLSVLFVVCFYICLVFAVYMAFQIGRHPMITGADMWMALGFYVGQSLAAAVGCLTVAKILKALGKIKHAVAPCHCHEDKEESK
ncbi:MAG: hypothetical protein IJ876_04260 [Elusimicrobiaceae bacterium]|nr:hypothetical protein [Elusimicrobiaceae bacterium]